MHASPRGRLCSSDSSSTRQALAPRQSRLRGQHDFSRQHDLSTPRAQIDDAAARRCAASSPHQALDARHERPIVRFR
jgi:hypothetical protein